MKTVNYVRRRNNNVVMPGSRNKNGSMVTGRERNCYTATSLNNAQEELHRREEERLRRKEDQ